MTTPPPLALYAHFPWCVRKCPYCDFNSHQKTGEIPEDAYVAALLADLDADLARIGAARPLVSMFFGGGTPSLFSPDAMASFIAGVRARLPADDAIEITLEANPGTIERGRFAGYRDAGVTRVSLGVQSFNATQLKRLGRIHQVDEVLRAVDELRLAGLDNFNLDLMYGLQDQTSAEALDDLRQAIALAPTHLSHYQLTLEPGTVFHHRPPPLPDTDECYAMQLDCQALLAEAGYAQYEISAYARANHQCAHNRNYWLFGDYLGVGAGAHGKLTLDSGSVVRTERSKQPRRYLEAGAEERLTLCEVPRGELPFEFMLNALRLREGFTQALFEARTGLRWQDISAPVAESQNRGLLENDGADHWRPTELGQRFLNDLQALFLAEVT